MQIATVPEPDVALDLALAVIASSEAPLVLLDGDLRVIAASASFPRAFRLDPEALRGRMLFALGAGEWDVRQLRSLLGIALLGGSEIATYEMDLAIAGGPTRRLVLNARKMRYGDMQPVRLLLSIVDVTDARLADAVRDGLLRDKAVLLQEVQHRVANSLQIIASVLLQSARRVQSAETREHLHAAHGRLMSVAALQQQLASSSAGEVALRAYLTQLCGSLGASMIRDHALLDLTVDADDSRVGADASVSLGLIVTELVINALKHAFPDGRHGRIAVGYRSDGADWTLSVRDDGIGIPKQPTTARAGLGTSIVEALARQLDARIEIEDARPGTAVSVLHRPVPGAVFTPARMV